MKLFFIACFLLISSFSFGQKDSANTDVALHQQPSDTTKFATLFVYRKKKFSGSMISYALRMDNPDMTGKVMQTVKNNSYFKIKLYTEGQTTLWAKTEAKASVMVNVKFGQTYYLRCAVAMGIMAGRPKLEFVDNEEGEKEYNGLQ